MHDKFYRCCTLTLLWNRGERGFSVSFIIIIVTTITLSHFALFIIPAVINVHEDPEFQNIGSAHCAVEKIALVCSRRDHIISYRVNLPSRGTPPEGGLGPVGSWPSSPPTPCDNRRVTSAFPSPPLPPPAILCSTYVVPRSSPLESSLSGSLTGKKTNNRVMKSKGVGLVPVAVPKTNDTVQYEPIDEKILLRIRLKTFNPCREKLISILKWLLRHLTVWFKLGTILSMRKTIF